MSLRVFLNLGRTHEYGNLHMCMGMQEHIKIGGSSLGNALGFFSGGDLSKYT
jgi:hypothetical protein